MGEPRSASGEDYAAFQFLVGCFDPSETPLPWTENSALSYNLCFETVVPSIPMNISVKGEYALQALFDLASRASSEPVKIAAIARRQKIPQKFLELILAGLKQGGFVESRRGAEGGYLLARPAATMTVGEVLRFIEGPQQGRARTRRKSDSPFSEMWQRVDAAVSEVLDHTTFAELNRAWSEKHARFVPNWEI